jgi:hypothetical protein
VLVRRVVEPLDSGEGRPGGDAVDQDESLDLTEKKKKER